MSMRPRGKLGMISNIVGSILLVFFALGTIALWAAWTESHGVGLFFGLVFSFIGLQQISASFRAARSYTPEDLQVEDNGFRLQHQFWPFDNIRQVKCYYVVTRQKGRGRQLVIELAIDSEKRPKRIYADPVLRRLSELWGRHRQDHSSADLLFKYERLCKGSFETRCAHYVDEIKRNGFFTYNGKRFHLDGDIVYRDGLANIRMEVITRAPFAFNVGTRWDRRVSTQVDADVFYWLLERLFGIRFGAEATPPTVGLPGIPIEGDLNWLKNNDDEDGRRFFDSKFGAGAAERFLKAKASRGRTYR
jgi:hypothetical protein